MPRTRDLRPNFNDTDDMAKLSAWARLLYLGLWGHMDRQGLIEDSPLSLRSKAFPRENHAQEDIEKWRDELLKPGPSGRPRLIRLPWKGKTLLFCPGIRKHNSVYSDEPALFDVPEDMLKQLCDQHGIEMKIKPPPRGKKGAKESGGLPAGKPPASEQDAAGTREEPGRDAAGTRPPSSTSPFPSPSPQTSTSPSPSASAPNVERPGDNSGVGVENQEGTGENNKTGPQGENGARAGPQDLGPDTAQILDANDRLMAKRRQLGL